MPWLTATARLSSNLAFQSFKNTNAPIDVSDWAQTVGFFGIPRNTTQYSDRPGFVLMMKILLPALIWITF